MAKPFLPSCAPWITEREIEAVRRAMEESRIASTPENLARACQALRQFTAGHDVLLTTSCTAAMELALLCLDLTREDEVILPSFTFVSTANAVLRCGARPVLVDVEADTLNIDLHAVQVAITPRTRVVMPVHYAGISCDMDRLSQVAERARIRIVEDAAHAVGARYRGHPLGTLGTFGCFSFHDTKHVTCGEGGALVINDSRFRERAEILYEKGTNRGAFLRGEIDKYTWVDLGGSFPLAGILAELLRVQLERFEEIRSARAAIVSRYREGLQLLVHDGVIRFTETPPYATPNHHLAFFLVTDPLRRDPLLAHLREQGVGASFHYVPLHLSPFAAAHLGMRPGQLPVTERVAASIVRLPLFPHLPLTVVEEIVDHVVAFFHPHRRQRPPVDRVLATPATSSVTDHVDLSLVVPCYNEAAHLHRSLDDVLAILDQSSLSYEVILIDDHSTDATVDRMHEYVNIHPHHRLRAVFHEENKGRGATVTEGIRLSAGRFVGFLDIDLEISARYLPSAVVQLREGRADMVLAERNYKFQLSSLPRWLTTTGYRWLVQHVLRIPPFDTEAGFKFFRRELVLPVLEEVRDPHWFWDTEITVRCWDRGLRIHREPVLFIRRRDKVSTVHLLRDSVRSLRALSAFRRRRSSLPRSGP